MKKTKQHIIAITIGLSLAIGVVTAQAEPTRVGPNGGRILTSIQPQAEFFVTADRYVQITFLDDKGAIVPPSEQTASLLGGDRSNPIRLSFISTEGILRSTEPLPELSNMPIILTIQSASDTESIRERFYLNQHICSGCGYEEYACTCGH
jgi:hypothetical protein